MDPFREPTQEEARIISKQATREIVYTVLNSLIIATLFCPIGFVIADGYLHSGQWGWAVAIFLLFGGFAGLLLWKIVSAACYYVRVRRLDYKVVVGVCGKKSTEGYRPREYYLRVIFEEGRTYNVETSETSFKKAEIGTDVLVAYHPKKRFFLKRELWAYLSKTTDRNDAY